jgi:hypothetical protein
MGWKRQKEIVPWPSALTVITKQKKPITRAMKAQIEQLIAADTAVLVHEVAAHDRQAHAEAVAHAGNVTQQLQETESSYQEAQAELQVARTSPWSLFGVLLFGFCASAVALCEFYITNATLPLALDIVRTSLLGIALSIGPTAAFVFVEKPLEHLQQSTWRKTYIALLWLVLVGTLVMVWFLTKVRHEIARVVQEMAQGKQHIVFNDLALSHAILTMSLLLIIVGAFFLLWARQCGRPWLRYRKARVQVRRLHKRRNALHTRKTKHTVEVATCQTRLDGNRAQLVAEHFTQQCRVALAKLTVEEPTSTQQVESMLGLALHSTAAMN